MPDSLTPPVGHARPGTRRRGEALVQAIFAATLEQLRTIGYAALTMDSIAAASGTGKAALYRRWADKEELVTDVLRHALPDPAQVPLTGVPRADILALLRCMRDMANLSQDAAFQTAKKEPGLESGMAEVVQQHVFQSCRDRILAVLERGAADGILRAGADIEHLAEVGPAMLVYYALTRQPLVPESYLVSIVDSVILPVVGIEPPA